MRKAGSIARGVIGLRRLLSRACRPRARPFDKRINRDSERCQFLVNDVLDDDMVGVEIAMAS